MKRLIAIASLAIYASALVQPANAVPVKVDTPKTQMFYVIEPHPDDEMNAWSMAAAHADDYEVFVTMTQGEGTTSCMDETTALSKMRGPITKEAVVDEATWAAYEKVEDETWFAEGFGVPMGDYRRGPFKYQGPDSPVGEEDKGERHPFGNPWVGQWTEACKQARIASWHWFLDEVHGVDGTGTDMGIGENPWLDDDYRGFFCPPGSGGNGDGRADTKKIGCAEVWANDEGARIAFDFGNAAPGTYDGNEFPPAVFGVEEVTAAIKLVRENRKRLGLPELPEVGMVSMGAYYNGGDPACTPVIYNNDDHRVVTEALRYVDHGAGPQYGSWDCPSDPYAQGAEAHPQPQDWTTTVALNWVEPTEERRIGAFQKNYGWVLSTYQFAKSSDLYWKVFD